MHVKLNPAPVKTRELSLFLSLSSTLLCVNACVVPKIIMMVFFLDIGVFLLEAKAVNSCWLGIAPHILDYDGECPSLDDPVPAILLRRLSD